MIWGNFLNRFASLHFSNHISRISKISRISASSWISRKSWKKLQIFQLQIALNPYEFWRKRNARVAMTAYQWATCCPIFSRFEETFWITSLHFSLIIIIWYYQQNCYLSFWRSGVEGEGSFIIYISVIKKQNKHLNLSL